MEKSVFVVLLSLISFSFAPIAENNFFEGVIIYEYNYTDLRGNDITEKLAPYLGKEQHYFINNSNYKAFNENNDWVQLFNSSDNTYYYFKDSNTAVAIDATTKSSDKFLAENLKGKTKIAGYKCESIKIESDNNTTIYYYSNQVKVNTENFSDHNFGSWNKYLEATDGALALKYITVNKKRGYQTTAVAREIIVKKLSDDEFLFPDDTYTLEE